MERVKRQFQDVDNVRRMSLSPGSEHPPIERLFVEPDRPVTDINLGLFGLSRFLPGYHLIKQLADEPERIDLVIMLTGREAQEL